VDGGGFLLKGHGRRGKLQCSYNLSKKQEFSRHRLFRGEKESIRVKIPSFKKRTCMSREVSRRERKRQERKGLLLSRWALRKEEREARKEETIKEGINLLHPKSKRKVLGKGILKGISQNP